MAARRKAKVPLYGNPNKTAMIEDGATVGATIGTDLFYADGSVVTLANLAAALALEATGAPAGGGSLPLARTLWSLIQEIPPNVTEVAELATSGLVVRQASGNWLTRSIAVASTDRLTVANADGDAGAPTLDLADLEGLSLWGRALTTTGKPDAITGVADQVARVNSAGTLLAFGAVNLAAAAAVTGRLAFANLTQIAGTSVLGVAGASTADVAAITAGADDRLLGRTSGSLSFSQLTLGMIPDALITFAKLQNADALSVLGRASNSSGVLDEIAAGADDRLLTRVGSALAFTQLTAGMFPALVIPDAALSTNVALLDRSPQSFTGSNLFTLSTGNAAPAISIQSINPTLHWNETGGAANNRIWYANVRTEALQFGVLNDANTLNTIWLQVERTAQVIDSITLTSTAFAVTGTSIFSATAIAGVTTGPIVISNNGSAYLQFDSTGAASNERRWYIGANNTSFFGFTRTDAGAAGATWLQVERTGAAIDLIALQATTVSMNGVGAGIVGTTLLTSTRPLIVLRQTDGGTDDQYWRIGVAAESFSMDAINDAGNTATAFFQVERTDTTIDSITLSATSLLHGALTIAVQESGNFTGTLTGMTGATTGTISYSRTGKRVTLRADSAISGTSNTTAMTMTGLPAALQPAHAQTWLCGQMQNGGGSGFVGNAVFGAGSGTITFGLLNVSGTVLTYNGTFQNTLAKGLVAGWAVSYDLA